VSNLIFHHHHGVNTENDESNLIDHLHHGVNTENDGPEVLGSDANLDGLDDGEGECHTPEDPSRRADIIIYLLLSITKEIYTALTKND
jgi:hypothetical protein